MKSKKLKKLTDAENFVRDTENVNKALKIYKELCLSSTINPNDKIEVVTSLLHYIPDEGREMLIRLRDMIPFSFGNEQRNLIKLLTLICKNSEIESHERCITAITLYNQAFYDVCFDCFGSIATDKNVIVKYRVEACRYLFFSEIPDNKELSQECLIEILENHGLIPQDEKGSPTLLPSDQRYKIIAGFISKTGFSSYLNAKKVPVVYDEEFVCGLQSTIFYDVENGIRERILSGQHLCSMDCVATDEKETICNMLLYVVRDENYEENIRADAADVVLRLGKKEQSDIARQLITELGYSALGKKGSLMDRIKTVYNNSQNIHDETISKHVDKFIDKIIEDSNILQQDVKFETVQKEVTKMIKGNNMELNNRYKVYGALNRISLDTAEFTKNKITMAQLFVQVWLRIKNYYDDVRKMLEERLIQELMEMGNTCSSGHAGRLVNVFAGIDGDISISYEDQIIANLSGRIKARIRDIPDQDVRTSVSMATFPDANEEDIEIYRKFIGDTLEELHEELYNEFVGDGYISKENFENHFAKAKTSWVI